MFWHLKSYLESSRWIVKRFSASAIIIQDDLSYLLWRLGLVYGKVRDLSSTASLLASARACRRSKLHPESIAQYHQLTI